MSNIASGNRCQHISARGRRCRERRSNTHHSLCPRHARHQERQSSLTALASNPKRPTSSLTLDLLGPVRDFRSAATVNHVLGRLMVLLTAGRISPRNAAVTGYLCQLLLQSLDEVKDELWRLSVSAYDNSPEMKQALQEICNIVPPVVPPVYQAKASRISSVSPIVPPIVPPVVPPVHQAVPPVYQARSGSVSPAIPPSHHAKSESVPPPQAAKSDSAPPAAPPAPPPKPQPFGFAELPRQAKLRHLHGYR